MKRLIALLLFLPLTGLAQQWTRIADERGSGMLDAPATVRFGLGTAWVEKAFPAGAFACTLETFGSDPIVGTVKVCERLEVPPPAPVAQPLPACWPKPLPGAVGSMVHRWENEAGRVHYWYCPGPYEATFHGIACRYSHGRVCYYTPDPKLLLTASADTLGKAWAEMVKSDWMGPEWVDITGQAVPTMVQGLPPPPAWIVARNGTSATRPAYPFTPIPGAKPNATNGTRGTSSSGTAAVGSACDCVMSRVVSSTSSYCGVLPTPATRVALCTKKP